ALERLRLSEGGSRCAGRLEIFYRGQWGTVCNDEWGNVDTGVVCRQLGCGNAMDASHVSSGPGSGPIWLDEVQCSGDEPFLWNCSSDPWGEHDCGHHEDVKIMCSGNHGPRLVGGEDRCSGRVEVLHGEQWGTLCDVHFGLEAASVICEHLQCGAVKDIPRYALFGKGTGPIWKENYRCRGNESRLWECPLSSAEQFNCSHQNDVHVVCSDTMLSLRLMNGGNRCEGRVEIYYNHSWGRVQDSLWDMDDAKVVCRQLECGRAIAAYNASKYGESEGPVWVYNVQCRGNESHLWNCSSFERKPILNNSIGVGVMCSEHKQLRLADGGSPCAGRVEVYYNKKWGSVCDDSWDLTAARLVCKQLGCGDALQLTLPASCGPGTGPIWLNELDCFGNESFLWDCPKASRGSHDCSHKEDVKVMCSEHKELRLVNGKHRCEGRVEIFYNGIWGTLCSDNVDKRDAEVICKQLQCGPHMSINYDARSFGEGSGPIWLDEIDCGSHESTLWQCQSNPWGQHNCYHREDASVVCSESSVIETEPHSSRQCTDQTGSGLKVRLVGGNTRCSGRVEILCNNTWDTVCDDSWDMADADVVCRQLDCGLALQAPGGAAFGTGDGAVWLDEVRCTGSESILSDCPSSAANQPDCHHKEDASVICSGVVTGDWVSPVALEPAIYEEIDNIPPGKESIHTRASDSASIDSLNQIEYYTSHSLGDTDSESENDVDDDIEAETVDSRRRHLLLDLAAADLSTLTISGGDASTLG
ncbi:deleted in malignant brain tumors 1 protein-like, partial [Scyliorhinus canicula]|uniref:deleted in malignant brain tumors 1 protein-like n=1 Tax=Scyliorhinus canicula TaxID=7830 RepID=UPI0018F4A4A8